MANVMIGHGQDALRREELMVTYSTRNYYKINMILKHSYNGCYFVAVSEDGLHKYRQQANVSGQHGG